jgi:alkanesulfonate monooxygenase SsuD/methylene tetrahydromethanopterin reductase-like flavin-dependent oxidoreductase (luciferase family)
VKYGVILAGGPADEQLQLALLAERSGWDGVFVWEAAYGVDAWTLLGAVAAGTSRIRLGTMLTPLPWRRPWKVASQVATLDQLSAGRAILTVGLGAVSTDLPLTGETLDLRTRAGMLDEGIDLVRALWQGRSTFHGRHYDYTSTRDDLTEVARPVQDRIPIWVVGVWPRPTSMRRALRCDGLVPQYQLDASPANARAARDWLTAHGAPSSMDVIAEGETVDRGSDVTAWADAGCTWWLESRWEMPHHSAERIAQMRDRIAAGPPTIH